MDFTRIFSAWEAKTPFRRLEGPPPVCEFWRDEAFLRVSPGTLSLLAQEAFHDLAFYLRTARLEKIAAIPQDPSASKNDRYVAEALLRNALIAAEGVLPLCQDTGTATTVAWKGERVLTGGGDEPALHRGVFAAYGKNCLRASQVFPSSMCAETNTGSNMPAQTDIYAVPGNEYRFLFVAKGGGSANKTSFFQESKALLTEAALEEFIREKVRNIGVAACPPYRLALVVGGLSPEMNLKTLKLATTGFLDLLPDYAGSGAENGPEAAFLDSKWSGRLLEAARAARLGAQFGGKYFALDALAIRLPRHAASCPVSLGVSCNADRNILAKITAEGVFLETLERNPGRFLKGTTESLRENAAARIDLTKPMNEILRSLSRCAAGDRVLLSGPLVVARDMAHARLFEMLKNGEPLPPYFRDHPVYYAGPAKTPEGYAIGSFGPTTAQRMDGYLPDFMAAGFSRVSLAKGNRGEGVTRACKKYGGFYLGTIGGAAALLAKEHILKSEVLDFPEFGMEAVRRIEVREFPAFVLSDDKGNDFYSKGGLLPRSAAG
ncbi:MAG: FumA C-terminus/TtdB family hydratase beta subunit [Spirochaetia bacterium]|jgi:fumarate hydratase class I|nr:FumA C-terminus/TtdB family hydratase beta subunit [Spirochaetia bacterium]